MYRFFDLMFLLIFFIPIIILFICTFLLCLIFQGRPIFFKQFRGGFKNKKIIIFKFRSMTKIRNKKKITKLGKFLRNYKLDEIPQFYNVFIGELSIVGPRPLHFEYKNLYSNFQKRRFLVKPGLTGYAQTFLKNNDSWKKKIEYDVWYVKHKSLILDLNILFKTFYNLFFQHSEDKIPARFNGKN